MSSGLASRGLFLTLEGLEGVGKSTNLQFVRQWLTDRSIPVIVTREPGGTPLAEEVRTLLLADHTEPVDPLAELLLIFAARAQHLQQIIKPALEAGQWVLSDRFTDATFAYQGGGRMLSIEHISQLEALVQQGLQPDKTIFLDLDAKTGLERVRSRGEVDRFEKESAEFFDRVRAGYHRRIAQQPERFAVIDASRSLAQVQQELAATLEQLVAEQFV